MVGRRERRSVGRGSAPTRLWGRPHAFDIGRMSSTGASKFTRKSAQSGHGGEAYASTEMVHHASLIRERYTPLADLSLGVIGLEDCESLPNHVKKKRAIAERYLARRSPGTQQHLGNGESGDAYWPPGLEGPAGGQNGIRSDMGPRLRQLESGTFHPGGLRTLRGISICVAPLPLPWAAFPYVFARPRKLNSSSLPLRARSGAFSPVLSSPLNSYNVVTTYCDPSS